jgi:GTPase SAR1 family protein
MIIYITGASGSGKTTLLHKLPIKGYDLDDIYEANWKKHRKVETVQKGVKKDIESIVLKHKNVIFVGLQGKEQLQFTPDKVYVLIRNDYDQYYRDKLVRDLNLLCKYRSEFEDVLRKKPFEEFRDHFWSNDIVNMKSLDEFKQFIEKIHKGIRADFSKAEFLTASEIIKNIKADLH